MEEEAEEVEVEEVEAGAPATEEGSSAARRLRSREGHAVDACMLALAADHVASGIAGATGQHAGGNSLDNTIRYGRIIPCEWILCDIQIDMMLNGIVHGRMNLFSPDGVLMATASQSMIKRVRPAPD